MVLRFCIADEEVSPWSSFESRRRLRAVIALASSSESIPSEEEREAIFTDAMEKRKELKDVIENKKAPEFLFWSQDW